MNLESCDALAPQVVFNQIGINRTFLNLNPWLWKMYSTIKSRAFCPTLFLVWMQFQWKCQKLWKEFLAKVEIGGKEMVCALQEGGLDMLGLDMQEADRAHTCDQES